MKYLKNSSDHGPRHEVQQSLYPVGGEQETKPEFTTLNLGAGLLTPSIFFIFLKFIFHCNFPLPFVPLMSPSCQQSPPWWPCPRVLFPFCSIPPPPHLPPPPEHLASEYLLTAATSAFSTLNSRCIQHSNNFHSNTLYFHRHWLNAYQIEVYFNKLITSFSIIECFKTLIWY